MFVRVVMLIGCLMLASCDQLASVGTLQAADAAAAKDGGSDRDASDASADAAPNDAGDAGDAGSCAAVMPSVCNPVKNQGCPGALGMQCAIDYAWTLTGYCIFAAPPAPGMTTECFNSGVTESCPPMETCFADHCEKICLCDADCDAGQCCTQPIEATGFSVCVDC